MIRPYPTVTQTQQHINTCTGMNSALFLAPSWLLLFCSVVPLHNPLALSSILPPSLLLFSSYLRILFSSVEPLHKALRPCTSSVKSIMLSPFVSNVEKRDRKNIRESRFHSGNICRLFFLVGNKQEKATCLLVGSSPLSPTCYLSLSVSSFHLAPDLSPILFSLSLSPSSSSFLFPLFRTLSPCTISL